MSCVFPRSDVHGLAFALTAHDRCKSGATVNGPTDVPVLRPILSKGPSVAMAASSTWTIKRASLALGSAWTKARGPTWRFVLPSGTTTLEKPKSRRTLYPIRGLLLREVCFGREGRLGSGKLFCRENAKGNVWWTEACLFGRYADVASPFKVAMKVVGGDYDNHDGGAGLDDVDNDDFDGDADRLIM